MNKFLIACSFICLLWSCDQKKETEKREIVASIESPTGDNSAQPFLFSGEKTLLSWIESQGDSIFSLKYSELKNEKWDSAKTITSGTNWFVNWADFPAIAEQNGNLLSHYLQMSAEGTYTYDIRMKLFNDQEGSWKDDFILHKDGTKSEHGFVSMIPYKDDSFFITWLDGRNTGVATLFALFMLWAVWKQTSRPLPENTGQSTSQAELQIHDQLRQLSEQESRE